MKPEPIYISPGSFRLAGQSVEYHLQDLDVHITRLHSLLSEELKAALAEISETVQNESLALITFTGAFTGLSTLLTFCSFIRGVIALERGMETAADKQLVGTLRKLLVPIVTSHCEILKTSMENQPGRSESLLKWYREALAAVVSVHDFIGRLG